MIMRAFFIFSMLLALGFYSDAQDIIHKYTGETIEATVVDISPGVIKYKKYSDSQGPIYSIAREQVEQIVYADGKITRFEKEVKQEELPEERSLDTIVRQSPTFGWHLGLGVSSILGDILGAKPLMASSIGASFVLPVGQNNTIMFGLDLLSVGCGLDDFIIYDFSENRWEFSGAREDLGYISLVVMDRIFLNAKRSFFLEGGGYGSFLMNASFSAQAEVYSLQGAQIDEGSYTEDWTYLYKAFDFGFTVGLGGRIPLGKSGKWHITAEARCYYGLTNIIDPDNASLAGMEGYSESNIFGLVLVGVDIPTTKTD